MGSQETQSLRHPGATENLCRFCELGQAISLAATWMLKGYIMHICVVRSADFYLLTYQTQQIWNTFFSTRSQQCKGCRWSSQSGGRCPTHLCRQPPQPTGICNFRAALARKAGILIRTAPSSDTMTQQMGADNGFIARLVPKSESTHFGNIYNVYAG